MNLEKFQASLKDGEPPAELAPLLQALWWDGRGNWSKAHEIAQDVNGPEGARVHAYLHRKEGDAGNAGYWYRQAGRPHSRLALDDEWAEIATALLG